MSNHKFFVICLVVSCVLDVCVSVTISIVD